MIKTELPHILARTRKRLVTVAGGASAAWSVFAIVGVLALSMWLDLMFDLSTALRLTLVILSLAAGAVFFLFRCRGLLRASHAMSLARQIDQVAQARGQIIAGVDLMVVQNHQAGLAADLAGMAVQRAADLCRNVPANVAIRRKPFDWAVGSLAAIALALTLLTVAMPRLVQTQWLRFSDPFGDHPPYSPIVFHVEPGNTEVVYASTMNIHCAATGGLIDRAELVLLGPDLKEREVLPMFPEQADRWRATVADITSPGLYFVRTRSARSHRYRVSLVMVPRLEEARFRITPPAYTGRPVYDGQIPQGGLSGLPGTRVEISARSNRPLSGGTIRISTEAGTNDIRMTPDRNEPRQVMGSFNITAAGKAALNVTDVEGKISTDPFTVPIALLVDQRPFIRLLEPQEMTFATPSASIPAAVDGEDDYGISRVQLYRSLNESRPLPVDFGLRDHLVTRFNDQIVLPLGKFGLQPGDVIKLFARIEDNDPAGAKGSESSISTIRIISDEDYQRMLRTRQGLETLLAKYDEARRHLEAAQDAVEQLEKELSAQPPDQPLSPEQQKRLDELTKQLDEAAGDVRDSLTLELPYDLDKNLSAELKKVPETLESAAKEAGSLQKQQGLSCKAGAEALSQLRKNLGDKREEYRKEVNEPLDYLAAVYPVLEDQSRFTALYLQQRSLAERLKALDGHVGEDDPTLKRRMRDLQEEQAQLRQSLRDLLDDIEQHAAVLPDDKPELKKLRDQAEDFVRAVRKSEAGAAMSRAETGLAEFSGTIGYQGALSAADILESFLSKCSGVGQQGRQCLAFQPRLSSGLGATIEQLLNDAGLGTGAGMGVGAGGGFSAMNSTLQNVGLYGTLPTLGRTSRTGDRSGRGTSGRGGKSSDNSEESRYQEVFGAEQSAAVGSSAGGVPTQYRHRVGAYFERIADETGQLPPRATKQKETSP